MSGLSCSAACGILVPQPDVEPTSPALQGGFSTSEPQVMKAPQHQRFSCLLHGNMPQLTQGIMQVQSSDTPGELQTSLPWPRTWAGALLKGARSDQRSSWSTLRFTRSETRLFSWASQLRVIGYTTVAKRQRNLMWDLEEEKEAAPWAARGREFQHVLSSLIREAWSLEAGAPVVGRTVWAAGRSACGEPSWETGTRCQGFWFGAHSQTFGSHDDIISFFKKYLLGTSYQATCPADAVGGCNDHMPGLVLGPGRLSSLSQHGRKRKPKLTWCSQRFL